jgi:thiol-disulfide isomerase/thioredoxin
MWNESLSAKSWKGKIVMRAWILAVLAGLLCAARVACGDAAPAGLAFADLVNHPERWPDKTALTQTLRFGNGATLQAGQQLNVRAVVPGRVQVLDDAGTGYVLGPDQCDIVAAANAMWGKLTPDQRNVTLASIRSDVEIWPVKIRFTQALRSNSGRTVASGTEVNLVWIDQSKAGNIVIATDQAPAATISIPATMTDLIERARDLVAMPVGARPSRVVAQLKGRTVDSSGKPVDCPDAGVKYFVLYYGAGWCAPCLQFSPELIAYQQQIAAGHPEFAFVLISEEDWQASQGRTSADYDGDMLKYMAKEGMNWPAVPTSLGNQCPALGDYVRGISSAIPILIVVDRAGKIVVSGQDASGQFVRADYPPEGALDQLKQLVGGPGK